MIVKRAVEEVHKWQSTTQYSKKSTLEDSIIDIGYRFGRKNI